MHPVTCVRSRHRWPLCSKRVTYCLWSPGRLLRGRAARGLRADTALGSPADSCRWTGRQRWHSHEWGQPTHERDGEKKPMSKCFDIWEWCCFLQGGKLCNSHNFFADKDENFVLRQHAPNEVQQVRLFLLFADNQHHLLHWLHSLQHHRRDGGKGYCTSNAVHYLNICNTFQCAVFIRTGTSWKQTNYWHH